MHPKDADSIANSEDPDQTALSLSTLIWVCTICPDQSVQKLRIITVLSNRVKDIKFQCISSLYSDD